MARIYYREAKLSGQQIDSEVINIQQFDAILNSTDAVDIDFEDDIPSSLFGRLFGQNKHIFKKVQLRRDNLHYYQSEKGSFYIPSGILFFDRSDYNFPSEFYFIAKIGDQLEFRKCKGGKDIVWHQIPDLHQPITDPKTIKKIESTFAEVKKWITKESIGKAETQHTEDKPIRDRLPLSDSQKQAYQRLTECCVHNESDLRKISTFIETLGNYEGDADYLTTLNYFMEFLEKEQLNFMMSMDWKAGVEDLEWLLSTQLQRQYKLHLELPTPDQYDEMATVSVNDVFEDFDRVLRQNGLQLGFIDTQSDEYVAVLHRINDKEEVKEAVAGIGYGYEEV